MADLVILEGNPLKDIRAAREIRWVIKEGNVYDPKELLRSAKGQIGPKGPGDHKRWELEVKPLRPEPVARVKEPQSSGSGTP